MTGYKSRISVMPPKILIGYTSGVYDLLHIGHINLLRNAKACCDTLIVGVTTDELAMKEKGIKPEIAFADRFATIQALRFVDAVIPQDTYDKLAIWDRLHFDVMFVGDDWHGKWKKWEEVFDCLGVRIMYFPYTKSISSTIRRNHER